MLDLDLIYPHVLHIGSQFGAFYWVVMKNVLVLQFLNITLTFLDAILLYYIIEFWGGKRRHHRCPTFLLDPELLYLQWIDRC